MRKTFITGLTIVECIVTIQSALTVLEELHTLSCSINVTDKSHFELLYKKTNVFPFRHSIYIIPPRKLLCSFCENKARTEIFIQTKVLPKNIIACVVYGLMFTVIIAFSSFVYSLYILNMLWAVFVFWGVFIGVLWLEIFLNLRNEKRIVIFLKERLHALENAEFTKAN